MDDAMFHRVHSQIIIDELWRCRRCGSLIVDPDVHEAIHRELDTRAAHPLYNGQVPPVPEGVVPDGEEDSAA